MVETLHLFSLDGWMLSELTRDIACFAASINTAS